LENHRDVLVRFLAAHLEKAQLIREKPEQAAELAAAAAAERNLNISPEAFALIFERINFQVEFQPSLMEELQQTAAFLKEQGKIQEVPEFYYDRSLLADAKELVEQ
jgi:ABC-type nitrate/sulfonate/bicarbonate transport system substrate-binding protein